MSTETLLVVLLTAVMMVVEITAGYLFGSMALLADGWRAGNPCGGLGHFPFQYYRYARQHADNPRFSFGTGKVTALGGFASAITLVMVALLMGAESVERLIAPHVIQFNQAILVAVIGLVVNLVSAWLLQGGSSASVITIITAMITTTNTTTISTMIQNLRAYLRNKMP